jgi:hypothetical protein
MGPRRFGDRNLQQAPVGARTLQAQIPGAQPEQRRRGAYGGLLVAGQRHQISGALGHVCIWLSPLGRQPGAAQHRTAPEQLGVAFRCPHVPQSRGHRCCERQAGVGARRGEPDVVVGTAGHPCLGAGEPGRREADGDAQHLFR